MNKKKTGKKIIVSGVIIAFALFFIMAIGFHLWTPAIFFIAGHQTKQLQVRLLCKTDHKALLEACREVLKRGNLEPGRNYTVNGSHQSPEVSRFPRPIFLDSTSYVRIDEISGFLILGLSPVSGYSFGIYAYPENYNYKETFKGSKYGDKELIPGLWYYDDNYLHNPDYDKKIEAFLKKKK